MAWLSVNLSVSSDMRVGVCLSYLYVLLFEIVSMGAAGGDPRVGYFLTASTGTARGDP